MTVKEFLKLRKQNDIIKLITVLIIVIFIISVLTALDIYNFKSSITENTEYDLLSSDNSELIRAKLEKIREMDDNIAVDVVKNYSISFSEEGDLIGVKECTANYLRECYGINDGAFHISKSVLKNTKNKGNDEPVTYFQDGKMKKGYFVLNDNMGEKSPIVKSVSNISFAENEPKTLCAVFKKKDINGETVKKIEALGFTIVNKTDIEYSKYQEKLFFTKLKYNIIIIIILSLFTYVLTKNKSFKKDS